LADLADPPFFPISDGFMRPPVLQGEN
jgi:hypothetical protein